MRLFKKPFLILGICLFLPVFFYVLTAETSHHHSPLETQDNCSICSCQQTASQAATLPAPPPLAPIVLTGLLFLVFRFKPILRFSIRAGRSPPTLL